jgi:hypothetical protein
MLNANASAVLLDNKSNPILSFKSNLESVTPKQIEMLGFLPFHALKRVCRERAAFDTRRAANVCDAKFPRIKREECQLLS